MNILRRLKGVKPGTSIRKVTTIEFAGQSRKEIDKLKTKFNVDTDADVIFKALGLAVVATEQADEYNNVSIRKPDNSGHVIVEISE